MDDTMRIYLSGGMGNLTFEESNKWREQIEGAVLYEAYDYNKKPVFFNPNDYYNFVVKSHETEREVMEFDLYNLRNSDLVIVNFNDPKSLGTMSELAIAYERRIPCVGLNVDVDELHPWQTEMCSRVFGNLRELVDYIVEYYLQ